MKALKWIFSILFFHSTMCTIVILFTLVMPMMLYSDIKNVLTNEVPTENVAMILLSFFGFFIYLAMRSKFLGMPYRKITILLPLLQMCIYTSLALSVAIIFLNKWANEGLYSKEWAIALAIIAIVIIRLLMSLLYWKYPLVKREDSH